MISKISNKIHGIIKPKELIRTKYCVFRKIERFLEDMLNFFLTRFVNQNINHLLVLNDFLENVAKYGKLFSKKCGGCGKYSKYSQIENNFLPCIYKLYDSESNEFYHEDCFKSLTSGLIDSNALYF